MLLRNGRRVFSSPQYLQGFRNALRQARNDLRDLHWKHLYEMADLRRELDETRAALNELRAATLGRQHAEAELRGLYRERAIQRARAAERDPAAALN
jgi:hypothetical protein